MRGTRFILPALPTLAKTAIKLMNYAQYFSLIKIILKILFCATVSFSLLLILLGHWSPRAVCVARAGETP